MRQLRQGEGCEGCLAGRLGDRRAADCERGAGLPRDHGGGEVPRRDQPAHAHRLLDSDHPVAGDRGRDRLAVDPRRLLAEPLEEVGRVRDLALGVGERLAVLQRYQGRQVLGVLVDQLVPPPEQLGAAAARLCAEGGEGRLGCLDCLCCVLGVELGAGADQLAGGWVVDLEGLAGGGLDPFAVDVADVGLEEGGIFELVRVMD